MCVIVIFFVKKKEKKKKEEKILFWGLGYPKNMVIILLFLKF